MRLNQFIKKAGLGLLIQTLIGVPSLAANYEVNPNLRTCLVLRKSSSIRSRAVDCVDAGQDVKVLAYNPGGYSRVSINGRKGYLWTKYLKPIKPTVQKPPAVASKPPPKPVEPAEEAAPPAPNDPPALAPTAAKEVASVPPAGNALTETKPEMTEVQAHEAPDQSAAERAPMCGGNKTSAPDMWKSVESITKEGIIPEGQKYDINGPSWPKLVRSGDKLEVDYGPNKKSMCTSTTATAFMKHMADLVNSGAISLTDAQLDFINRRGEVSKNKSTGEISTKVGLVRNALNGDTNSVALLYQALGGESVYGMRGKGGDSSAILNALKQARPGDVLKIDHRTGGRNYGHSTIFKEIKGNQVCYWSSSKRTKGAGVDCKPIANITYAAVSRLPEDVCEIPKRLSQMMGDNTLAKQLRTSNTTIAPNWIAWKTNFSSPARTTAAVETEDVSGAQR